MDMAKAQLPTAAVAAAFVAVSLTFDLGTYRPYNISKCAALTAATTLLVPLAAAAVWRGAATLKAFRCWTAAALLAYNLALVLSAIFSRSPETSFKGEYFRQFGLLTLLPLSWMALFTLLFSNTRGKLLGMVGSLAAVGVLNSLYALSQATLKYDPFRTQVEFKQFMLIGCDRPVAFCGNADFLAPVIMLSLVLTISLTIYALSLKRRLVGAALTGACLFQTWALIATNTRGTWLALPVALAALLAGVWLQATASARRKLLLGGGAALLTGTLLFVLAGVFFPTRHYSAFERLASLFTLTESSGAPSIRLYQWRDSLNLLWDSLRHWNVFGTGPETFGRCFMPFKSLDLASLVFDKNHDTPHMSYLGALICFGLPGLAAYLAIIGCALTDAFKAMRGSSGPQQAVMAGVLAALVGYAVNMLFVFETISTGLFFFVLVGLAAAARRISCPPPRREARRGPARGVAWTAAAGAVAMLVFSAVGMANYAMLWRADRHFNRGNAPYAPEPLKEFERACQLYPHEPYYRLSVLQELGKQAAALKQAGKLEQAVEIYNRTLDIAWTLEGSISMPDKLYAICAINAIRMGAVDSAIEFLTQSLAWDKWSYATHDTLCPLYYWRYQQNNDPAELKLALDHAQASLDVLRLCLPYKGGPALHNSLAYGAEYCLLTHDSAAQRQLVRNLQLYALNSPDALPIKERLLGAASKALADTPQRPFAEATAMFVKLQAFKTNRKAAFSHADAAKCAKKLKSIDDSPAIQPYLDKLGATN